MEAQKPKKEQLKQSEAPKVDRKALEKSKQQHQKAVENNEVVRK
jgi:hypothetical protein